MVGQEGANFDMGSDSSRSSMQDIPMEMDLTATGVQHSDDEAEPATRERRYIQIAKRVLPHVGLVLLLVAYLLVGATIFHAIEGPNELVQRDIELRTIFGLRDDFRDHIWNITQDSENKISREAFNSINQEYFENLAKNMFISYRNQYINENHLINRTKGAELLWTYPNSIFFATTVITTIGYGNLVPTTTPGRVACIVFALFGIPLLLVTIADIGKFLSQLLSFLYSSYRSFKRKISRQSRRISQHYRASSESHASDSGSTKGGAMYLPDTDDESAEDDEGSLRIPVFMVLLVLLSYTAIGGFLFQSWEGLQYFEAFYFCFITMATVGFGDIVPTTQVYMFFTMAYIIFGLSLATMCIDLAGTQYIRKIQVIGKRMEDAKGAVITGLQVGENMFKQTGIEWIRTASGKMVKVGAVLNQKQVRELGLEYILEDLQYQQKNILYEPLSPSVAKLVKEHNIKIMPDDITERDGYIVQNKSYDRPTKAERRLVKVSNNIIHRIMVPSRGGPALIVPCLIYKESDV